MKAHATAQAISHITSFPPQCSGFHCMSGNVGLVVDEVAMEQHIFSEYFCFFPNSHSTNCFNMQAIKLSKPQIKAEICKI
jgi:hypothetical protein